MQNPAVVAPACRSYRPPGPPGPPGGASRRRQGRLPFDGRRPRSTARDICLPSGQLPPPAVRLFMIVGSWRRYGRVGDQVAGLRACRVRSYRSYRTCAVSRRTACVVCVGIRRKQHRQGPRARTAATDEPGVTGVSARSRRRPAGCPSHSTARHESHVPKSTTKTYMTTHPYRRKQPMIKEVRAL
jgi:hypothetical protein